MEIGGDLEARESGRGPLECDGQLRLVDAHVRGSASLSGVRLTAPHRDAFNGDRLRIGGELYLRRIRCAGTLRLQNAEIGATLDCTDAVFSRPRFRPWPDGPPAAQNPLQVRPSLDARAASVGKDLLLLGVRAPGGIRIRRMDARKSVQIVGARLGGPGARYALNAYGITTAELVVELAETPRGVVRLEQAHVGAFRDSATLWSGRPAIGSILLDGFVYETLNSTGGVDVHTRLRWIGR